MENITAFLAGAFLCNCIPHLTSGLQGVPFPTPFAKPRGVGDSTPIVNFAWGALNFLAGLHFLTRHPVTLGLNTGSIVLLGGFLAAGAYLSLHFGKVRRGKPRKDL